MITKRHRLVAFWLVRLRIWKLEPDWLWGIPRIKRPFGTEWLHRLMLRAQRRDHMHHAPACPGNEWDGQYLVLKNCSCGAARKLRRS
jgi:hypothetical protein